MLDPVAGTLIVAGVALLLLSAAWHKARGMAEFASILAAYRILPRMLVPVAARAVPLVEIAIAVALLVRSTRYAALLGGATLLLAYALAIAVNLRRGRRDLDCGCTGPSDRRPIAGWMVVRNVLLAASLGLAALPWSTRSLGLTDALTIAAGVVIATLLYLATDRLLGQVMPRGAAIRRPT